MLSATNLQFERQFLPVFEPVSMAVAASGLLLITGDNGSGKTTLIRLLAGLLRPSAGKIVDQANTRAYVGHQLAVKDDLSVHENLLFAQQFTGGGIGPDQALERMGLARVRDQAGRTLSAGQRKRCALARLLLCKSELWLLDEPYSNLDAAGMTAMDSVLNEHLERGGACVMSTHGELRPAGLDFKECELRIPGRPE